MRLSSFVIAAIVLGCGCAHVGPSMSEPDPETLALTSLPPAPNELLDPSDASDEPDPPEDRSEADPVTAAGPNAEVVVIEPEDLGGDLEMVVAPPKRPSMPSMMSNMAMAPNR